MLLLSVRKNVRMRVFICLRVYFCILIIFSFLHYSSISIDSIPSVWTTYTEAVGVRSVQGDFASEMRNGVIRVRVYNTRGNDASYVRVNANMLSASLITVPFANLKMS